MISSDFEGDFPEIDDKSTIPELIIFLRSSFREDEFKLVERILIRREEELKRQLERERVERKRLEMQEKMKNLKREKKLVAEESRLCCEKFEYRIEHLEKASEYVLPKTGTRACCFAENDLQKEDLPEAGANGLTQENKNDSLHGAGTYIEFGREDACDAPFETIGPNEEKGNDSSHAADFLEAESNGLTPENKIDSLHAAGTDTEFGRAFDVPFEVIGPPEEKGNDSSYAAASNRTCAKEFHGKGQFILQNHNQAACSSTKPKSAVIEIIDSDDEAQGDEKPHVPNTCIPHVNSSKEGVTFKESGRRGYISETGKEHMKNPNRKRSLTDNDDSNGCSLGKRKAKTVPELLDHQNDSIAGKLESAADIGSQSILTPVEKNKCLEKAGTGYGLQTASRNFVFDGSDDSEDYSTDSEDESSDLIEEMIASMWKESGKSLNTLNVATDMLSELRKDNELCMSAVCALYRKKISAERPFNYPSSLLNPKFDYFDAMSGQSLAEYLIDGDPEYKLKRTVSEVQQKDPTLLNRCKDLAIGYYGILFEIYRSKEDPFFHPKT